MTEEQTQVASQSAPAEKKAGLGLLWLFLDFAITLAAVTTWGIVAVLDTSWLVGGIVSLTAFLPPTVLLTLSYLSRRELKILLHSWFFFYVWSPAVLGLSAAAIIEISRQYGPASHLWAAGLAILTVAHLTFIYSRVKRRQ